MQRCGQFPNVQYSSLGPLFIPRERGIEQAEYWNAEKGDGVRPIEELQGDIVHRMLVDRVEVIARLQTIHAAGADGSTSWRHDSTMAKCSLPKYTEVWQSVGRGRRGLFN